MRMVYIVVVNERHISSEGYDSDEKAIKFIEERSDKPQKVRGWYYKSKSNTYEIKVINVK